jgi:hypothetical protein
MENLEELCKIWISHIGDYKEVYLLGYNAIVPLKSTDVSENISPQSLILKNK